LCAIGSTGSAEDQTVVCTWPINALGSGSRVVRLNLIRVGGRVEYRDVHWIGCGSAKEEDTDVFRRTFIEEPPSSRRHVIGKDSNRFRRCCGEASRLRGNQRSGEET